MSADPHSRAQEVFSQYLEGDLPAAERQSVEDHVSGCAVCKAELERFRSTLGKLGGLREKAPRGFLPGIQRQIFVRSKGRFFSGRWLLFGRVPFEWVSLLMIVAMLVYYIISQQAAPTEITPGP